MKNKSVARILIVGLSHLGLPVAKHVKERGGMGWNTLTYVIQFDNTADKKGEERSGSKSIFDLESRIL
ncbi:MAG: hypothetical protein M3044_06755 [Thermoproteota archaeon]|nr:hypothetical protein [Thermoproteota archaeon]